MKNQELYHRVIDHYDEFKYALLEAQTFSEEHYGFPPIYYKIMETDRWRVGSFVRAFKHYDMLKDATVCEAGVGTLALTKHYMPYVKKAYLIEMNPELTELIKAEISRNGWTHKTEFITGDAMKIDLPEMMDYIIAETMSIFCGNEYQVQIFKHLRQFLKPGGKLIPEHIVNLAQLVRADFEDGHEHYPLLFTRHWPETLSTQEVVNEIDLYKETELEIVKNSRHTAHLTGDANAIFMRSLIQLAEGINFTGTDSLMPPTVALLDNPMRIEKGKSYTLQSKYSYGGDLGTASFSIVE